MPHTPCPVSSPRSARTSLVRTAPHRRPNGAPRRRRAPACEWLHRCLASRCDDSWRRLLARYGVRIHGIIAVTGCEYGLRLRPEEVEELAQDLFLYWLRRRSRFDGRTLGQLWKFLLASVRHLVIDHRRRVTADKRAADCDPWLETLPLDQASTGELGPSPSRASSCRRTPECQMLRREELLGLQRRFVGHCRKVVDDERDAEVLAQAVLGGRSSGELSRELARSGRKVCRSTIDSWVHKLRRRLADQGLVLPRRCREPDGAWPAGLGSDPPPTPSWARPTAPARLSGRHPQTQEHHEPNDAYLHP